MYKFMVRVTNTPSQTKISIPRIIARATGLDHATDVTIEDMEDKSIVIKEWKTGYKEERNVQKNQT